MASCAFEFAEDGGNDTVVAPDASGYTPAVPDTEDLPAPAAAGRGNYRGMLPDKTVFALDDEASSGGGAAVFNAGRSSFAGALFFFAAGAGLVYLASRR